MSSAVIPKFEQGRSHCGTVTFNGVVAFWRYDCHGQEEGACPFSTITVYWPEHQQPCATASSRGFDWTVRWEEYVSLGIREAHDVLLLMEEVADEIDARIKELEG